MSLYGHVRGVKQITLGSDLAADVALGATTVVLDDTLDFEEPQTGYPLILNMLEPDSPLEPADGDINLLSYTALDEDTNTLTLANPTETTYAAGGRVEVYPRVTLRYARVALDDAEEEATGVRALVPHSLYDRLPLGPRETVQEAVEVEDTDSEYVVSNVRGKEPEADGTFLLDGSVEARKLVVTALSALSANVGRLTAGEIIGPLISTADAPASRVTMKDIDGESDRIKFYTFADGLRGNIHPRQGGLGIECEPGTNVIITRNALKFDDASVTNQNPGVTQGTAENLPHTGTTTSAPHTYLKFINPLGETLWVPAFR